MASATLITETRSAAGTATSGMIHRPSASKGWTSRLAPCIAATIAAAALACRPETPLAIDPTLDPQLVAVDYAAPSTRFDGEGGGLLLGEGWAPIEYDKHQTDEPIGFAWVTSADATATIRFVRPPAEAVDFVAHCLPFTFEGAPRQAISVAVGENSLMKQPLPEGWQLIRAPLPRTALSEGLNTLQISFDYTRKPSSVGQDPNDDRSLSAACRFLGVVPRSIDDAEAFFEASRLDIEARQLHLPLGASAAVALPFGSQGTLRLGSVHSRCDDCALHVELDTGGRTQSLWRGRAADAGDLRISFATEARQGARLRLSFENPSITGPNDRQYDSRETIEIDLPEGFLEVRHLEPTSDARPDVFIYVIDTLRADLAATDESSEIAPEIAAFAADAVLYRNTWSASTWTLPSVVSILTGVYPFRHHVMKGKIKFSEDSVPSLGEMTAGAGYDTIGISQSFIASRRFGVNIGFEHFLLSDQLNSRRPLSNQIRRLLYTQLLARAQPERPILAYLHTVDPHAPYSPEGRDRRFAAAAPGNLKDHEYEPWRFLTADAGQDPDEIEHLRALYNGDVAHADREFGNFLRMLQYLGLYEGSLIVLVSDHGEEFSEHGAFDHGRTVYEEVLRVPLLIKYPRSQWAGQTIDSRVSTVDIVPTVLRTAGIEMDAAFDGRSLRPPDIEARTDSGRRILFAEINPEASEFVQTVDYRTIAFGRLKCIESLLDTNQFGEPVPQWQVFDLEADPGERRPLDPEGPRGLRCRQAFAEWLELAGTEQTPPTGDATDPETQDRLRALGYIE